MESTDLNWGKCPKTFRARVTAGTEGGVSGAQLTWAAAAGGASGSVAMKPARAGAFRATLGGLPVNTELVLTVTVTGPAGSATSEPVGLAHNC